MKNMQNTKNILWGIIVIAIFILQFFCRGQFGDDIVFADVLDEMSLAEFLNKRYYTWSSRVIIEAFLVFIVSWDPWIWQILNGLVIIILIDAVSKTFGLGEKHQNKILFSCLLLTIPVSSLNSAGWITTNMNYLWPLSFGMTVIASLRQIIIGNLKISGFLVSLIAIIYAANMEQMAALLLGAYLVSGIYMLATQKQIHWMYFVQLMFIILSLCFILFCPGNARRTIMETEKYFPVFEELTVIQKLCMGFLVNARHYIAEAGRPLFLVLNTTLVIGVIIKKKKNPLRWVIACFPILSILLLEILKALSLAGLWKKGLRLLEVIWNNNSIAAASIFKEEFILIQILYYLVVLLCVIISIYWIHGRSFETLLELIIIAAGFMSRFMIGFSPTIYASGDRTALFASVALLIIVMRNIQGMRHPK